MPINVICSLRLIVSMTVTDFTDWTLDAQKALWQEIAHNAVSRWGLRSPRISWLGYQGNAVFRVATKARDYVLRLHPPGRIDENALRSELVWLRVIRQDSDLLAPVPITPQTDGSEVGYIKYHHRRLPHPHVAYGCLFEYIAGESKPASELGAQDMDRVGRYLGRLHRDAQFEPPVGFIRPRLDWHGLFGDDSPYYSTGEQDMLSSAQGKIFRAVAEQVRQAMGQLDDADDAFGLIHGDLLAKNIIFVDGIPAALDFEYSGWGYFLYDLAPLLWQLKGDRPDDYPMLEEALWQGYACARAVTDQERALAGTIYRGASTRLLSLAARALGSP